MGLLRRRGILLPWMRNQTPGILGIQGRSLETGDQGGKTSGILELLGRSLEKGIQDKGADSHKLGKELTETVGNKGISLERGVLGGRKKTEFQGNYGFLDILEKKRKNI